LTPRLAGITSRPHLKRRRHRGRRAPACGTSRDDHEVLYGLRSKPVTSSRSSLAEAVAPSQRRRSAPVLWRRHGRIIGVVLRNESRLPGDARQ
jgi:hypothetical protein